MSLQKKLQEAKHQRKKVETDAKLLEYRVNLLQNQEKIVNFIYIFGYQKNRVKQK